MVMFNSYVDITKCYPSLAVHRQRFANLAEETAQDAPAALGRLAWSMLNAVVNLSCALWEVLHTNIHITIHIYIYISIYIYICVCVCVCMSHVYYRVLGCDSIQGKVHLSSFEEVLITESSWPRAASHASASSVVRKLAWKDTSCGAWKDRRTMQNGRGW